MKPPIGFSRGASLAGGAARDAVVLRFADCELWVQARELWREGKRQPIANRVFDLLVYLIERTPATASHVEIARAVWGHAHVRPAAIAQAVLQARRALGDDRDEPSLILSVRGIGYRFIGQARMGAAPAKEADDSVDLGTLRVAVAQAQEAAERDDFDAALFMGENAVVLAEQLGAKALMAKAMAVVSWAAMHRGTLELAGRYAFEALRIAEAEEHGAIAAFARVRAACVLYACGDLTGALELLEAAFMPDGWPATDGTTLMGEALAGRICSELRRFDDGHAWLDRALTSALRLNPDRLGIRERLEMVFLHLQQAHAAEEDGQALHAHRSFETALALNEALADDCMAIADPTERICWSGNQGMALCGLGRMAEALHFAKLTEQKLEDLQHKFSPWYLWHAAELAIQWATLLHKTASPMDALRRIETAVAEVEPAGRLGQLVRLSMLGSKVCEALGDYRAALTWSRRAQQAQQRQCLERLAQLSSAFQASRGHAQLVRELTVARTALAEATAQLQALRDQMGPDPHGHSLRFLVAPEPFELELKQRYFDAKARDLPCLVGLVHVEPSRYAATWDTPVGRQSAMLASAARIQAHLGTGRTRMCQWSDTILLATIEGVGIRRGLELCEALSRSLNHAGEAGDARKADAAGWAFQVSVCDFSASASFEEAMQHIQQLQPGPAADAQRPTEGLVSRRSPALAQGGWGLKSVA